VLESSSDTVSSLTSDEEYVTTMPRTRVIGGAIAEELLIKGLN